jgi:alkane 1-monooxygenase
MNFLKKLGFLTSHFGLATMLLGYYFIDKNFVFFPLIFNYVIIPILDQMVGIDRGNIAKEDFEKLTNDRFFDVAVYFHVYAQWALTGWTMYELLFGNLAIYQIVGLILSQGLYSGTIINVAHELGHRQSKFAQFHAKLALLSVCYMHFIIEHNRGHHVNVATPNDPASSLKNQTVFAFWGQSVVGSFKSAWDIEAKMLTKKGKAIWSWQNEMIRFVALEVAFLLGFIFVFSLIAGGFKLIIPIFIIGQCIIAILLLESVNYIEHYGLSRKEITDNRFERVNPLHSWNASQLFSNLVLFHLQRHSDHHAYASRSYQVLRHFDESPQLPFGYPVMVLMCLVPPLWFKVMNKQLEKWENTAVDAQKIAEITRKFA